MPMVGHYTVRKKCYGSPPDGGFQKALECDVIGALVEKDRTFGGSIDNMEDQSCA